MRKLLSVVLISAMSVACAGNLAKVTVAADTTVVDALLAVKAAKDVPCDAGKIPASSCQAVSAAFVPVWDAYLTVNALVSAEAPIEKVDAAVIELKAAAAKFKDVVGTIQGDYKQILLDLLEQALRRFDR